MIRQISIGQNDMWLKSAYHVFLWVRADVWRTFILSRLFVQSVSDKDKKVLLDRHQVECFHFGVGPEIFRCCFLDDSYDLVQIFKAGSNVRNEDNNINNVLIKNVWTNDAF